MYVHTIKSAAIALLLTGAAAVAAAADRIGDRSTVTVRVVNLAPIATPFLERALRDARRIYRAIGVDIAWTDRDTLPASAPTPARELRVVLLAHALGDTAARPDAMGVAVLTHDRPVAAYVFADRVEKTAYEHAIGVDFVLATVIAHELGHLIVGNGTHSRDGLMRAHWRREELIEASQGQLRFSPDVSAAMRRQLAPGALTAQLTHRASSPDR